jgi:hypothetical protein
MKNIEFGDSFLGTVIGCILLVLLFLGEPDIFDCIRAIMIKLAGL